MTGLPSLVSVLHRSFEDGFQHATVTVEDGYGQEWGMYWLRWNRVGMPAGWYMDSSWAEANAEGLHEAPNDAPEEIQRFALEELGRVENAQSESD